MYTKSFIAFGLITLIFPNPITAAACLISLSPTPEDNKRNKQREQERNARWLSDCFKEGWIETEPASGIFYKKTKVEGGYLIISMRQGREDHLQGYVLYKKIISQQFVKDDEPPLTGEMAKKENK